MLFFTKLSPISARNPYKTGLGQRQVNHSSSEQGDPARCVESTAHHSPAEGIDDQLQVGIEGEW